ncbi:MAG: UDP-N-acetylmuramoyl-L-alanyl-D-glutamate--2,6-diaminopimelate ligase [Methyloglobulus sp.]|nr:UDP-N-acetylmuramoyl-L-alanyl-D-glutamate--2,6-diaminopimelate ligase [Methyloglobulus sp.]
MRLTELLNGLVFLTDDELQLIDDLSFSGITLNSREVAAGDLFIALAGAQQHGLAYAGKVIEKGACAILFDPSGDGNRLAEQLTDIRLIPVENISVVLGKLAAKFYGNPSQSLDVLGITGTNGKTSCSQFLGQLLDGCGVIGTLGWGKWGQLNKTINTTPDALTVQQILAEFSKAKMKTVAMEVSSHGLDQGRVNGVHFKGAVFTNISRDHLDYHGTMENYLRAKLKLLAAPGLEFVVINLDDANSSQIVKSVPQSVTIWGVSAKAKSIARGESVTANEIRHTPVGTEFNVHWQGAIQQIKTPLFGDFNVENLLCVLGVMLALGESLADIAKKMQTIQSVTGRLEPCSTKSNGLKVFIDYAHTPDALHRVLASLRKHCKQSLWVVFGCGGNRDAGKRPQMGSIAEQWADRIIVTDDNPRFENNVEIANAILAGCSSAKVKLIQDRKQAIQHAIANAAENDCIVIAGKGHETYQEISGVQYPFNDKQIAEQALQVRFAAP